MTLAHMGMSIPLTETLQSANNRSKCTIATNARIATVAVANGFMDLPPCHEARQISTPPLGAVERSTALEGAHPFCVSIFGGVEHLRAAVQKEPEGGHQMRRSMSRTCPDNVPEGALVFVWIIQSCEAGHI
jgi:hypothetical protein